MRRHPTHLLRLAGGGQIRTRADLHGVEALLESRLQSVLNRRLITGRWRVGEGRVEAARELRRSDRSGPPWLFVCQLGQRLLAARIGLRIRDCLRRRTRAGRLVNAWR